MEKAKLVLKSPKGSYCDKMRNSIIIPTINDNGEVVCFDFYLLDRNEYLKYPNTEYFQRKQNLYSYNVASKSGKQSVIVVCTYPDYFKLMSKGITNVVSTYIPTISECQITLLKQRFKAVLFLTHHFDNIPQCKVFFRKNCMYCEQFNIDLDKPIVEFIDENEFKIKERVEFFEQVFGNSN